MGDGMRKRSWVEVILAFLIPPARREDVLGDLQERNASLARYLVDAIHTLPFVIASRIRQTCDPGVLAMHIIGLYFAFYVAVWFEVRSLLSDTGVLWRLAIPCVARIVALVLENAYGDRASAMWWLRAPMLAVTAIGFSELMLWAVGSSWALPLSVVIRGGASGLVWTLIIGAAFHPPSKSRPGRV
jgi:hypothetical protein